MELSSNSQGYNQFLGIKSVKLIDNLNNHSVKCYVSVARGCHHEAKMSDKVAERNIILLSLMSSLHKSSH